MFPFIEDWVWQVTTIIKRYVWGKKFGRMIYFLAYASHDLREGEWKGHMGIGKNTSSKLIYQRNQKNIFGGKHQAFS